MASLSPLQICIVRVRLGEAYYPRPCVILTVEGTSLRLAAISSKMDLYRPSEHLLIREDDPDFSATGLETASYVLGVPIFRAESDRVLAVKGALTGDLAKAFTDWIG
ncbi:MAG TPA: hypothetical protein VGP72_30360 [Planctomycetota bacterium]|jgi:hypothetical protein